MMPICKRLAQLMFEVVTLRSSAGTQAIYDMMSLCEQKREVEFRPGLEPDKCCCFNDADAKLRLGRDRETYDWMCIYNCSKAAQQKLYGWAARRFGRLG